MKTYHFKTNNEKNKQFNEQGWFVVAKSKPEALVTAGHFIGEFGDDDKYSNIKIKEHGDVPSKVKSDFKTRFEERENKEHLGLIPNVEDLESLGFDVENENDDNTNLEDITVKYNDKKYFDGNAEKINELAENSTQVTA